MEARDEGFASPEQIARWRIFGLVDGCQVSGHIDTRVGEVRLFDAPIADGFTAPSIRIREFAFSRMVPGTLEGRKVSEDVVKIRKGWLFATNSRFIAYNNSTHDTLEIPYPRIMEITYEKRDFYLLSNT